MLTHSAPSALVTTVPPKLHVGIGLTDTLLWFSTRHGQYKTRPNLAYFAKVLRKNHCDVTIFSPFREEQQVDALKQFRADFPHHHRIISRCDDVAEYMTIMESVVASSHSDPTRVLFLESHMNFKFYPWQTLLVDRFKPQKRLRGDEKAKSLASVSDKYLAATSEDMSLVAVADMINELTTTELSTPVEEYLKMEPLVERVSVPGQTDEFFFLPDENCDHIERVTIK